MPGDLVERIEVMGILNLADVGLGAKGINRRTAEAIQALSDNSRLRILSGDTVADGVRNIKKECHSIEFCAIDWSHHLNTSSEEITVRRKPFTER